MSWRNIIYLKTWLKRGPLRNYMKIKIGDQVLAEHIRVRVRLDYKGKAKSGRFFFGSKTKEEMAELVREQQVTLLRNVPLQGVIIEELDLSLDIYTVDESDGRRSHEVAYAPIILTLRLENIDDLIPVLIKSEFRKIEFLSPENINTHRLDLERLLYRLSTAFQQELKSLEHKYLD